MGMAFYCSLLLHKEIVLVQASLENLMETQPSLSDTYLNRLFALLNWTLTEFTISSQVRTFCHPSHR